MKQPYTGTWLPDRYLSKRDRERRDSRSLTIKQHIESRKLKTKKIGWAVSLDGEQLTRCSIETFDTDWGIEYDFYYLKTKTAVLGIHKKPFPNKTKARLFQKHIILQRIKEHRHKITELKKHIKETS